MKRNIDFNFMLILFVLCLYLIVNSNPNVSYVRGIQRMQTLYDKSVKKYTDMTEFFMEKKARREASVEWYQNKIVAIEALKSAIQANPKNAEILRWYNEEVKNFNTAIMRNTHGAQYKGAEISMKMFL